MDEATAVGRSISLRDYRAKHSFKPTWTNAEIQRGRLKTIRVGRDHRVTEEGEREHLELLRQEAEARLKLAGAA